MARTKQSVFIGGMILITLGVLLYLSKTGVYPFGQTWPVLLIVVGIGTLIQKFTDIGGWVITVVGAVLLIHETHGLQLYQYSQYILPAILILLGIFVLLKRRGKSDN